MTIEPLQIVILKPAIYLPFHFWNVNLLIVTLPTQNSKKQLLKRYCLQTVKWLACHFMNLMRFCFRLTLSSAI
jgi:hypothetical protein